MLSITNHQGNTNQNQNDVTSHLLEWLSLKRQDITSVGENLEKRGHLCTAGAATMENSMEVPQKIKTRTTT